MSKPEQIMVMVDKGGKPVSTDQLMHQFESILSKSQFSKMGGTQKLFIKLHPENLGSLRIELTQKDSTIIAKIMTSSGAAKDAIESQLQGLKQAFSSQNIHVDRIEVTQQFTDLQERSFQRDHQQGQQQSHEQAQKNQSDDGEFNQSFEEALLNIEV
jgi:flagellar hook-length control protein FliK